MKIETSAEHAVCLAAVEWMIKQAPKGCPVFFAEMIIDATEAYELEHFPIPAPLPTDPCFDCGHVHAGPVGPSEFPEMPAGRSCIDCGCTVRL